MSLSWVKNILTKAVELIWFLYLEKMFSVIRPAKDVSRIKIFISPVCDAIGRTKKKIIFK